MSKIFGCLLVIFAIGCSAEDTSASRCPTFPSSASVQVDSYRGPDFWDCDVTSLKGEALFSVYVGNHPDVPRDLRYAGTTESRHGNLVWFAAPGGQILGRRTWRTFVPTGDRSLAVAMASFTSESPDDFGRRAELVAQMRLVN